MNRPERTIKARMVAGIGKVGTARRILIVNVEVERPSLINRQPYLLKMVIPKTNALPRWRLNVETKTKRTLYSSRRLSFNQLTNSKNLVLHSSHFALNAIFCRPGYDVV
jgi:hypothetical protein